MTETRILFADSFLQGGAVMDLSALNVLADMAMEELDAIRATSRHARDTSPSRMGKLSVRRATYQHSPSQTQGLPVSHPSCTTGVSSRFSVAESRRVIKTPTKIPKSTLRQRVQLIRQVMDMILREGCSRGQACAQVAKANPLLRAGSLYHVYADRYLIFTAYHLDPDGIGMPSWLAALRRTHYNRPILHKSQML